MIYKFIHQLSRKIKIFFSTINIEGEIFRRYAPTASGTHSVAYSKKYVLKVEHIRNHVSGFHWAPRQYQQNRDPGDDSPWAGQLPAA